MNNRQGLIIAAVLVVAAGIAFVAWRGNAPSTGTEGAIGAANRYAAKQITSEDVALSDADVQSFLQSDAFRAIQTNPDFRKLVMADRSETERSIGMGPRTIELISQPGFGKFITDARFLPSKKFITLAKNKEAVELVSSAEVGQIATAEAFATLARSQGVALSQASLDKNFTELMKNQKFLEFMAEVGKAAAAEKSVTADGAKAVLAQVNTEAARTVKELEAYQALEKTTYFNRLVTDASFQSMLENKAFVELVATEKLATLEKASSGVVAELGANGALADLSKSYGELLRTPGMMELVASPEIGRLALDRSFLELVEMENVGNMLERSEVTAALSAATE
jgi:hypothetical protein